MLFISSKKLFSFWRYSNVCNFCPSFPHFQTCPQISFLLTRVLHGLHMCLRGGVKYLRFNISGRVFSIRQLWIACYATVTNPIWQLLALCDSYEPYPTVINAMWQLPALSDSYQPYATVIGSMQQLWVLSDSYQLYTTVISPIRQLSALCDSC